MRPTTKHGWLKIRSRTLAVFVSIFATIALLPTNTNWIGHLIDGGIHGLSVPGWAVGAIPTGSSIVAAVAGWLATKFGDPESLRFFEHGLTATALGRVTDPPADQPSTPSDAVPVETPPPPLFDAGTHEEAAQGLDSLMLARYANVHGIDVTNLPPDPIGPHGVNADDDKSGGTPDDGPEPRDPGARSF